MATRNRTPGAGKGTGPSSKTKRAGKRKRAKGQIRLDLPGVTANTPLSSLTVRQFVDLFVQVLVQVRPRVPNLPSVADLALNRKGALVGTSPTPPRDPEAFAKKIQEFVATLTPR